MIYHAVWAVLSRVYAKLFVLFRLSLCHAFRDRAVAFTLVLMPSCFRAYTLAMRFHRCTYTFTLALVLLGSRSSRIAHALVPLRSRLKPAFRVCYVPFAPIL